MRLLGGSLTPRKPQSCQGGVGAGSFGHHTNYTASSD
uniref:Uncharacterized protein n=1 Tax=Anguilla anguilla TaxID=7936 RepID=A0A0E9VG75_ANGAN